MGTEAQIHNIGTSAGFQVEGTERTEAHDEPRETL